MKILGILFLLLKGEEIISSFEEELNFPKYNEGIFLDKKGREKLSSVCIIG